MTDPRTIRCEQCAGTGMVEPDDDGRFLCPDCDGDGDVWADDGEDD